MKIFDLYYPDKLLITEWLNCISFRLGKILRQGFMAAFMSFFLIFSFLGTGIILSSCSSNADESTDVVSPIAIQHFISDEISIIRYENGSVTVEFYDEKEQLVTLNAKDGSVDQTLYDQNDVTVKLLTDGAVQLIEPWTSPDSVVGTRTYTIDTKNMAVELLHAKSFSEFHFKFADSSTGVITYSATFVKISGALFADLRDMEDQQEAQVPVTVLYRADTSRRLSFENPLAIGPSSIVLEKPVIYADVQNTLFSQDHLRVYIKTDGDYIIDIFNSSERKLFNAVATLTGSNQLLYDNGSVSLSVTASDEVYYKEPISGGTRTQLINPDGIMAQDNTVSCEHNYSVDFIEQNSGQSNYIARLYEETAGVWKAQFEDMTGTLVGDPVDVTEDSDLFGNLTYIFSYNNAAGMGEIRIATDTGGNVFKTTYLKL